MMASKNRNGNHHHKRKRTTNDEPSPPPTIIACSKCGLEVASRNQLFRHLRTSENCSLDNTNNNASKGREEKTQFVKVILVLAYLGKAYHGSARNDHRDSVPTVEGCLWKAIAQALSEKTKDNDSSTVAIDASTTSTSLPSSFALQIQENTNPKAMTRSSRTDKGVSSLGNIYSLLLPDVHLLKDEISFTSTINHHLPSDIRLLRVHILSANNNTPSSFDARTCCEARRYRYLIPAKALFRRGDGGNDDNEPTTESIMDLRKRLKKVLLQWGGTHSFHNFTNWRQPSAAAVATHDQRQNHQQKQQQQIPNEDDAKEPTSHFRHVLRCHVEDVIQHNHNDFLVISIKGQSFIYHQIRKMMGATIGVMNATLPPDFIARALKKDEDKGDEINNTANTTIMDVPLAPAEGLVLVECIYSKYCSKHKMEPVGVGTKLLSHGSSGSNAIALCSDWETAPAKLLKDTLDFQEKVYAQICRDQALKFSLL